MPADYQQALDYIHTFDDPYLAALRDHGKQTWGLARIRELLSLLGDPHLACPTIHVAGTKGKGSTCAFIAQGLMQSGLKTGLYVSPHLEDWRERIQVDRQLIPEDALARLVSDIRPHAQQVDGLSAFEVTTALAFWHFAREKCDAAVIEVGLGGRLDATSVVEPLVAVITSISLDHMQLLGDSIAEIAGEKAAIIKPAVPVVSAPQTVDAQAVIERVAFEKESRLILVGRDWCFEPLSESLEGSQARIGECDSMESYSVGLAGSFQIENAATALAALKLAGRQGLAVTERGCRDGLAVVKWPGRLEVISRDPLVIIDGAHNPYSIDRLIQSLAELCPVRRMIFVFGCMADKDWPQMLRSLFAMATTIIFTRAHHERASDHNQMAEFARTLPDSKRSVTIDSRPTVDEAVTLALECARPEDVVCITGSLALAGEARTAILGLTAVSTRK